MKDTRKPKNWSEGRCFEVLKRSGYKVLRRGYPDFICYKGNKLIFVEVKPNKKKSLKKSQKKLMLKLSTYGIPCYKWTPDDGFKKIKKEKVK